MNRIGTNQSASVSQPMWFAFAQVGKLDTAPYSDALEVTPGSRFGDFEWEFPEAWMPPGHHRRNKLCFSDWAAIDDEVQLKRGSDDALIRQLKEITYCLIFHRSFMTGNRKVRNARPLTIENEFGLVRQFLVSLKCAGIACLDQLDASNIDVVLSTLKTTAARHNLLLQYLECIFAFSRHRLVSNGPNANAMSVARKKIAKDTSKPRGVQPFTDDETAAVIAVALNYMEHSQELFYAVERLHSLPKEGQLKLISVLSLKFPAFQDVKPGHFVEKVYKSLQMSAFHLTGFHLGMRLSEFLSQKTESIGIIEKKHVMFSDRVTLEMTTVKAAESMYGHARYFPVHPYLLKVHNVMIRIRDLLHVTGDFLFTTLRKFRPWTTSNFNQQLTRFHQEHNIHAKVSSHVWRKTIVSTAVLSKTASLDALRELLGHRDVSETVAYALSSPFVKRQLDRETRRHFTAHMEAIVSGSEQLGGKGIGGQQGLRLETDMKNAGVANLGKRKRKAVTDRIIAQSMDLNMYPVKVDDGIDCLKQIHRSGSCASSSGDSLPDLAKCTPACPYRVEQSQRSDQLRHDIQSMTEWLNDIGCSLMEKVERARSLVDSLIAWPNLRTCFDEELQAHPELKRYFAL